MTSRTIGLLLAVATAFIAAGVLLFFALNHRTPAGSGASAARQRRPLLPGDIPPPEDLVTTPEGLSRGDVARIQFVDRHDPNRISGELSYARLDPLPDGRFTVIEPRAWIYLKDGKSLHITAPTGRITRPHGSTEPESGRFAGGVEMNLYAPTPGRAVESGVDAPLLRATTNTLDFDLTVGEVISNEAVYVSTPSVEFSGSALTVRGNQVLNRIEYLHVATPGVIRVADRRAANDDDNQRTPPPDAGTTPPNRAAQPPANSGTATAAAQPGTPSSDPATPQKIDLYRAVFTQDVRLTNSTLTLTSDRLDVWARMIDNSIPEDAITPWSTANAHENPRDDLARAPATRAANATPLNPTPDVRTIVRSPAAPQDADPAPAVDANTTPTADPVPFGGGIAPSLMTRSETDAVLTWQGELVMTPLDSPPQELATDHLAVRFTSSAPNNTRFADAKSGLTADARSMHYGATARQAVLTAHPGSMIVIAVPDRLDARLSETHFNAGTGVGHVAGPGSASAADSGVLTWTEQADFQSVITTDGPSERVEWASFAGKATAEKGNAGFGADYMRAEFVATPTRPNAIRRLVLDGNTHAHDERGGFLKADHADAAFDPLDDADDVRPASLLAVGAVHASQRGDHLFAEHLIARLATDDRGRVGVTTAEAHENVIFRNDRGIEANADHLHADAPAQIVTLTGSDAALAQRGTSIEGREIHLFGEQKAVFVTGEGLMSRRPLNPLTGDYDLPPTHIVTWSNAMAYNDSRGVAECRGDVVALSTPDHFSRDEVNAERAMIYLGPPEEKPDPTPTTDERDAASAGADEVNAEAERAQANAGESGFDASFGGRPFLRAELFGQQSLDAHPIDSIALPDGYAWPAPAAPSPAHAESLTSADNADAGPAPTDPPTAPDAPALTPVQLASFESRRYAPPERPAPWPGMDDIDPAALSGPPDADPTTPADLESRELLTLFYLEGDTIIADYEHALLRVPGAGRALLEDRRQRETSNPDESDGDADAPADSPAAGPTLDNSSGPGTSLFRWAGSMVYHNAVGELDMDREVRLIHRPLDSATITDLSCHHLTARLTPMRTGSQADPADAARTPALRGATAIGAVYSRTRRTDDPRRIQELIADRLEYDASTGIIDAIATSGNHVTLFDAANAQPIDADRLLWNTITGRIDVLRPSTISIPR